MRMVLYFFCVVVVFGCGSKKEDRTEVPPGILNPSAFASLLVDLALAESASNLNILNNPLHQLDSVYGFDPLSEHGVSKGRYDSTLLFYAAHPAIYRRVYDSVLVMIADRKNLRLQVRQDSL